MSEKQQRLVLSIIDFLNQSIQDGTVKTDDKEGLEVAIQCIAEAFGVDPSNQEQVTQLSVKPTTLQNIFDVYLKTRDKMGPQQPQASTSSTVQSAEVDKQNAEKLKKEGNDLMSAKKYDEAIEAYTKAIAFDPTNAIYYSNRAAAHASKNDHLAAVGDAEKAISIDPGFVKAYHRLGHAQYSLGDFRAAADAFERGLNQDPSNASLKTGLSNAQARITSDDTTRSPTTGSGAGAPNLGAMADVLRNMGGGAGRGGGMPDLASLMSNPQVMAMAQQLASNGGLSSLMQNPAVANMMNRVQSGDMPSMEELMGNPGLRDLANQFTGQGGESQ